MSIFNSLLEIDLTASAEKGDFLNAPNAGKL